MVMMAVMMVMEMLMLILMVRLVMVMEKMRVRYLQIGSNVRTSGHTDQRRKDDTKYGEKAFVSGKVRRHVPGEIFA